MERPCRAVEGRDHPVTGGVHFAAPEALELASAGLEELGQELPPARVAETGDERGRVDDVREQQRDEHAAVDAGREARPGTDARPLDLDARLVTVREAVVPGRDVEDLTRPENGPRPVGEVRSEATGDHHADVARLAPLASDRRPDVLRPTPPRVGHETPDRQVTEFDDVADDLRELDDLVGLVEALGEDVGHPISARRPCPRRPRSRAAPGRAQWAASR